MIEGLNSVCDHLRSYQYKESVYLQDADEPAHPDFVRAIEELYTDIFEYQVRLICYLSRKWSKRGIWGTMQLDDWKPMLQQIESSNDKCNKYCPISSKEKLCPLDKNESSRIKQSISDMFEACRTRRQEKYRDDKEADLLEILASDYKSDKDSIPERVPGTCEWFFEDDRFLSWRNNKSSSLLWVSAGPGCGKSVLSRALVEERRVSRTAMTSSVCYFFFKDGQEQRTRGVHALSALLHQLFENSNLISHGLSSYHNYGKKLPDTFTELWDILVKSAKDPEAGEIICILDALDECEEGARNQLIHKLTGFFSQKDVHGEFPFSLKFLVTSRPYDNIEGLFESLSGASTYLRFDGDEKSQKIGQEINLVIDAKISSITDGLSDDDRQRISDRLKMMNNRTYLWLYLTFDIIKGSRSNFRKTSSIDMFLSDLPSKVSDAYVRILDKSLDKDLARTLLQIIVAATRPLSLMEANIALTLATQQGCTSHKTLDLWPLQNFKSTVQNICGLFVTVHDGKLSLIHQTAREFLIQNQNTEAADIHPNKWQGCFDMATAHGTISKICFRYLNFDEFTESMRGQAEARIEHYPLFNYAALNWVVHYKSQRDESAKELQTAAQMLCNTSWAKKFSWLEADLMNVTAWCPSPFEKLTNLGMASFLGLEHVVEAFLNEGIDFNAPEGNRYALHLASHAGHDQTVQILLEKGAITNNQISGAHAMYMASSRGHEKVVQILLEYGANPNSTCGYDVGTVQEASSKGFDKLVSISLENGAEVNPQRIHHKIALETTSVGVHEKMGHMLLENGAHVNAQNKYHDSVLQPSSSQDYENVWEILIENELEAGNPHLLSTLQTATFNGYDKVVQLLVKSGADINAQNIFHGSALQGASLRGYEKVIQTLLENGADMNAQTFNTKTALQAASYKGHKNVVQMLLDHGADVGQRDIQGRNPLHLACAIGEKEIVEMLWSLVFDRTIVDEQGRNCLHHAAAAGSPELVSWLLEKGFDPNLVDRDGWTSLHWAAKKGSFNTMQVLRLAGAKSTIEAIKGWTPHAIADFHQKIPPGWDFPTIIDRPKESGFWAFVADLIRLSGRSGSGCDGCLSVSF